TSCYRDWSSDVCSSDLVQEDPEALMDARLLGEPEDARELVLQRAGAVRVDVRRRQHDTTSAQWQELLERRLVASGDHLRAAARRSEERRVGKEGRPPVT